MNTLGSIAGDSLRKAISGKKNYSEFIWKTEKKEVNGKYVQDSKKMIDMTPEELKKCYQQCELMLYNDNPKNLGRYNVLEEVTEQIEKCNIELFLRYLENSYMRDETRNVIKRFSLWVSLRQFMKNNPHVEDWTSIPITQIASNLPDEFKDINIAEVLDACTDTLGTFDKSHLTMTFITKMGIWFTRGEEHELKADTNIERLKIVKEKLKLPSKLILKLSEKGLSYHEMRAMLTLPKKQKQKYSDMTTEQLVTLRNKVLPRYQLTIDTHIRAWNYLKKQLEIVARKKGIQLNDENRTSKEGNSSMAQS